MFKPGRMISGFTVFLNRVLILLLSAALLALVIDPSLFNAADGDGPAFFSEEWLVRYRVLLIVVSAFLICLNLNVIQFIMYNLWNAEGKRYISSKTASGTARVSLDAIQRSLTNTAVAMPEIARCRLNVLRTGHTRYKVTVLFWMREGRSVINISEKLRLVLKKKFADLVTVSPQDRIDFDITLSGIQKTKKGGGAVYADSVGGRPADFKGPVYPVEGEN